MGLQQRRLDGEEYTAIIDEFMEAVYTRWPRVIVQVMLPTGGTTLRNTSEW
jgi:hypothetical protein